LPPIRSQTALSGAAQEQPERLEAPKTEIPVMAPSRTEVKIPPHRAETGQTKIVRFLEPTQVRISPMYKEKKRVKFQDEEEDQRPPLTIMIKSKSDKQGIKQNL
jgi:hypothetical protein